MTAARAVLAELRARGARVYRRGDKLRLEPLEALTPELIERARAVRAELLRLLPAAPPAAGPHGCGYCFHCAGGLPDRVEIAECQPCRSARGAPLVASDDSPGPWIVSSASDGAMRLLVDAHPRDWPAEVFRAAALVEVLDERTRADRADAQQIADELQVLLAALARQGVEAWLTS